MIRRKCAWCEKYMYFQQGNQITKFCSPLCYRLHREKLFTKEDDGPAMPPLDADRITDEGFTALVAAIVQRASDDVTQFSPGTLLRVDAENFFKSEFFAALTGLDGELILKNLEEGYKRRHKKHAGRNVRCIETGAVYSSLMQAGDAFGVTAGAIAYACKSADNTAVGLHFEYVEE